MMNTNKKTPKLRFKGFTDDWEQRKFSEIYERAGQKNDLTYGVDKIISVANMYFKKDVTVGSEEYLKTYNVFKLGDIAFEGHTNKEYTYGRFVENTIGDGIVSHIFDVFTPKINLDINFWKDLIKYEPIMGPILRRCTKASRMMSNLTTKEFLEEQILCPSLEEQKLIGEFIVCLDKSITFHQRKLEYLNLKKKALLQKLFPKNGECYPELRFPGFTDAWEQRKLGEIFEYLQNNTLSRDSLNYKNPNIKNIHYGDILVKFDEILDGSHKDIPYINSDLDLSKFSKSLLRDGDIVFSDTAEDDTVGKAIELQNVNAPFILGGLHTIPCRPLIPFGKGYLGNFLNSDSYRLQLRPLIQGIKVSSISKSALKDTMIEYPKNLDEQEKIGSLFYYIAKMITLHQRKLDRLISIKKGFLQQLFV